MPKPDLCILECVISGYYQLMNVIIMQASMYSPSACVWNAIDKQYDILAVSVVNTGGGLTLSNGRGRSQAETLPLALRKNSDAITLLQEDSLLTLAALLSSYGSLKSLVRAFALWFKAMTLSIGCSYYIPMTFCDLIGAAICLQWGQVRYRH